ncbi:MAG: hypothetical protein EPO09_08545, partial [Aquabacterium sp.]|uniref:tRNA lysidine(34) synthetase TilS n=1 Tax=Aquabacterium sp. TaxID=1872578 RepID=UPI0012027ABB
PVLEAAFPQAEACLAASAERVQDVLPVVDAWAEGLVASLQLDDADADGATEMGPGLDAERWAELSGAQRRLALAHWYRGWRAQGLSASWLQRLAHEVPGLVYRQHAAQWPEIALALYRGVLRPLGPTPGARGDGHGQGLKGSAALLAGCDGAFNIDTPGDHVLAPWHGVLRVTEVAQGGVNPELLAHARALARCGGEQFQMGPGRPPRALKKQFQSAGVPEWRRTGPLIWAGDQLVFVPSLGVDARCLAPQGSPQWGLEWVAEGT